MSIQTERPKQSLTFTYELSGALIMHGDVFKPDRKKRKLCDKWKWIQAAGTAVDRQCFLYGGWCLFSARHVEVIE